MIEIRGASKSFGSRRAIDNVTVSFPAGTVTCLLGLNGAGKSTLLRLIAGLTAPDTGSVRIGTLELRDQRDPMGVLGIHFDFAAMDPRHTVSQHLRWLATLGGLAASRTQAVLEESELTAVSHRRIATLSMGARQRLAIAGALLGDPAVLVFDEPINGLDVPGIVWFRHLLRHKAAEGVTVVMASHLLAEVVLTADRVLLLAYGRVVAEGGLDDIVPAGTDPRAHLEAALLQSEPEPAWP